MATRYLYTKEDLQNIGAGDAYGANWRVAGYDASWVMSDDYILMNDIDFEGGTFTPIGYKAGNAYVYFTGSLDGQGFEIKNGHCDIDDYYLGLFAAIGGAGYVHDLILDLDQTQEGIYVGGVAGFLYATVETTVLVENVTYKGTVKANAYYGGIAGYIYSGTVKNCVMSGTVVAGSQDGVAVPAGGIAGSTGAASASKAIVDGCVVSGTVQVRVYGGGIFGSLRLGTHIIKNCVVTGIISVTSASVSGICGGLVGAGTSSQTVTVENCRVEATLSCDVAGTTAHCGGLFGRAGGTAGAVTNISNSYSASTIYANASTTEKPAGLVGENYGDRTFNVSNNFYDSDVCGLSDELGGLPKSTAQMKAIATFSAWDIIDYKSHDGQEATAIWFIDEGEDYPKLWYEWTTPPPSARIKIAGTWLKADNMYLKESGIWKNAEKLFVKESGAWVRI